MKQALTTDNKPKAIGQSLKDGTYEQKDTPLTKGRSLVINRAGLLWIYMADDHRKDNPELIIVRRLFYPEFGLLPMDCKKSVFLL